MPLHSYWLQAGQMCPVPPYSIAVNEAFAGNIGDAEMQSDGQPSNCGFMEKQSELTSTPCTPIPVLSTVHRCLQATRKELECMEIATAAKST